MSGHNKWSKVKRAKEVKDKIKGNIFSKLSRIITLAVIEGGGIADPESNFKLRLAIDKAKKFNLPKENIQRAINNALGPNKELLKEVIYEGFGPGGVGLIIQATTDNPNRTLTEIRIVLDRYGGKLASQGAVSYMFKKCGVLVIKKENITEELLDKLIDQVEAFDLEEIGEIYYIYFPFENIGKNKELLKNINFENQEIVFKPQTFINLNDSQIQEVEKLKEALESLDDVQRVFDNYEKS